jgi:hypothetical protein
MRWLLLLFISFELHALTKKDVDRILVGCTQKSVTKNLRLFMESDLGVKPNSRTLVLLRNQYEQQDLNPEFDDSPFLGARYHTLDIKGEYLARFRFRLGRPLAHELKYHLKSVDEDGYLKTSLNFEYTPRENPSDKVDLHADYLPTVVYNFSEILRDQFGRISPDSVIKSYKVVSHPIFDQDLVPLKDNISGEDSEFEFDSKKFKLCLIGEAL